MPHDVGSPINPVRELLKACCIVGVHPLDLQAALKDEGLTWADVKEAVSGR